MTVFLDTNVVIALTKPTDRWHEWSTGEVTRLRSEGPLLISDIVYAEWSVGMAHQGDLDRVIGELGFERFPSRDDALFRAGIAFNAYRRDRRRRGADEDRLPKRMLPDMIVGAFASVTRLPLVTANDRDFSVYFPEVTLIQP